MKLATRLGLLGAGTICVILLIGITSFFSVSDLIKTNKLVSHSREVLQELNMLLYSLSDTVGTQRAYIITGQEIYLDSYHSLVASTNESIQRVTQLVSDNPEQSFRASKLNALIKERLASLDVTVKLYQDKGSEAAYLRIRTGKSLTFRIALHKAIDEMKQYEIHLLQTRDQEMHRSAESTQLTIIAGVCLGLAIVILFGFLFTKYIISCIRQLIRAADNIMYGRFDLSTSTNSNDEFAELAAAFNTLSQQLLVVTKKLSEQEKETEIKAQAIQELSEEVSQLHKQSMTLVQLAKDEQTLLNRQEADVAELVEIFANLEDIALQLERASRNTSELIYRIGRSRERTVENADSFIDGLTNKKILAENIHTELSRQADLYRELTETGMEVVIQNYVKLLHSKKYLPDKITKNINNLKDSINKSETVVETISKI